MEFQIGDDFIGIFDNAFPDDLCDRYIRYFMDLEQNGFVKDRHQYFTPGYHRLHYDDSGVDTVVGDWFMQTKINYISQEFNQVFWDPIYKEYSQKFSALKDFAPHNIYDIKIQRTTPGQGYHIWHTEVISRENCNRILVFMLYLNDVEEGGETEFLYMRRRVKPKKNRLVLWPAGFTHVHRGNPPISNDKYIITGWVEL